MSNILKSSTASDQDSEILVANQKTRDAAHRGFRAFDSLWQAGSDNTMSIAGLEAQKEKLRKEAEDIVKNAELRAAQIEKEAYDKGFAAGQQEGNELVAAKGVEAAALLESIQEERKSLYGKYEADIVELLKAMVEKIVNHEVSVNPRVIPACLRMALSHVIENSVVKVHINSEDFSRIRELGLVNQELLEGFKQLELIEDQAISRGGCLLETEFGEIDATIETTKGKLFEAIDRFFLESLAQ